MTSHLRASLLLSSLLWAVGCGDDSSDPVREDAGRSDGGVHQQDDAGVSDAGRDAGQSDASVASARIETRLTTPRVASSNKLRAGAASASGLASLKYFVRSIRICESIEAQGSGFANPQGCLELYRGDEAAYPYQTTDDFSPLAEAARKAGNEGFIDLLDPAARAALGSTTMLNKDQVRSYHYGVITWALPIKVTATIDMADGSTLYTHDGTTSYQEVGADRFRAYFTEASKSLAEGPAEEAVVLHGNGGNWFKFQSPLNITAQDVEDEQKYVLDLVFNPDGIVQGFSDASSFGQLRNTGDTPRGITVPMLDLAPVPHRDKETVVRESYQGPVTLDGNDFDLRLELYSVDGDAERTVYGVDVKSLVNANTKTVPPSMAKIAFAERAGDGSLSLLSFTRAPLITGLTLGGAVDDKATVTVSCGEHSDRVAAEGGAAVIVNKCPAKTLDVQLTLRTRGGLATP